MQQNVEELEEENEDVFTGIWRKCHNFYNDSVFETII